MERYSLLLFQAVLCVFCCGASNVSAAQIPPDVLDGVEERHREAAAAAEEKMEGYLLTMPQTLQAGAQEQYCLTLHGVTTDTTVTLELVFVEGKRREGEVEGEKEEEDHSYTYTHTYVDGQGQCKTFQVPDMPGRYEVNLHNETGIFANSEVTVLGNNLITFVQTDKPIYKPGQKVKFRIMTMTRNLRSRVGEIESVFIKDPNDFKVKKFANVKSRGMASLEFQLISEAKLGLWTIEVTVEGSTTTQTFKVEEYVLPRFEVTIKPPAHFLVSADSFNVTVCAKYTYGKPVKGLLSLQVCSRGYGSFGSPCARRQANIDGCHNFSLNADELLNDDRYYYSRSWTIDASVTEKDTGVQVNGTAPGPTVSYDPLKMEFQDDSNGYFKPGIPIEGRVKVSKLDGSPAVKESVLISASDHRNNVYMDKTFLTDEMGEIQYSVCSGFLDNTSSLSLFAEATNFVEDMSVPYTRRAYTPRASSNFRQWFSPSLSYIQLPARRQPLKCGETLNLDMSFTHYGRPPVIKFHYQVMARGRIVQSGTREAAAIPSLVSSDNCLEVKERPTPPPQPTVLPPIVTPDQNFSEVAPMYNVSEPELLLPVEEPPMVRERVDVQEEGPSVMEPPAPEVPLVEPPPPFEIQPLSESVGDIRRRKRDIMPPYGPGEEEEIVRSEPVSTQLSSVSLSINLTSEMSPKISVLVYYIREDGETVADSQEYEVQPCFDNEVKMEFAEKKVMPGAETTIHLEASAGSVCGVGVVDKSVNILGGDHQITPKKVFEKLAEYSVFSQNQYRRYSYFRSDSGYCQEKMAKLEESSSSEEGEKPEGEGEDEVIEPWSYVHRSYSSNYVDAIQAFKQMGMLVLTNLDVETRPCSWNYPIYLAYGERFVDSGPVLMESQTRPLLRTVASVNLAGEERQNPRSHFPETWLWELQMIGENGKEDIPVTVPDTITQWVGNSLCINDRAGFGLSPVTSIITFQPFFLAFNLPYNAVRGERLPITVTVYNYLEKCLHMQLEVDGMKKFKVHGAMRNKDPFCLCGGLSKTMRYYITAEDIGHLPIFAQAHIVPGQCGNEAQMDMQYVGLTDAVQRKVLVKAEGVTQRYSHSLYICPKDGEHYTNNFRLPLPSEIVPDSARGDVTVIGDIMGPALTNLDHLVRMPTGCGEQNMVGFTPNIYVLKYLTAAGRLTEEMEDKTKNFMEIGYQRELTYRHPDGSFSAFGPKGGKAGSTWLTAFVVKSFAQAKPFIFIDDDDLEVSKNYLISTQNPEEGPLSGCFFERGSVFSSYMQGGLGKEANDAALSAYVMIALLEAGLNREGPVAVSGMGCISRQLHEHRDLDVYTLSLVAYVNTLYDPLSPLTQKILQMLDAKATTDGELKHWKREGELPKPVNSWYYYAAPSAEVEMTSYALLAILASRQKDAVARGQASVYWLSQQRNAFGGYSSTQDTVLGLNALSEFAAMTFSDQPTNLTVRLHSGEMQNDFRVTDDNSLILQRQPVAVEEDSTMRVSVVGTGCALVQANVRYNKLPEKLGIDDPKFNLRADPRNYQHDRNRCDRRTLYITFGQRNAGQFSSGMTMLTVRMVTGWHIIPESLRALRSRYPLLGIDREEVDDEEGVINFYLDELDSRTRRFALDLEQEQDLLIHATKPAEVQIYQYYEKDVTVVKSYNLRTTCQTKQELPYDAPVDPDIMVQRRLPLGSQRRPEGREQEQRPPAIPQPAVQVSNCPVCNLVRMPSNFAEIVCKSTAVYKAHAGRNRRFSMKIKSNLRPRKKLRDLNWFANVRMAEGCQCPLLDPPQRTVLIITRAENLVGDKRKTLTVDSRTYVFDLASMKKLEREARKAQKRCRIN